MIYKAAIRPLLFGKDPESAHEIMMAFSRKTENSPFLQSCAQLLYGYEHPSLHRRIWGLDFPNPVGIAAGFDKNGTIPRALQAAGFGFIEIGSITAQARSGNPKPRVKRLTQDGALLNRMGLNNDGADVIMERLDLKGVTIPVGINIAKTHDPEILGDAAILDYCHSLVAAETKASYIMVNISCPNTAEGITFEQKEPLQELLSGLFSVRTTHKPVLVKFSPDLQPGALHDLLDVCERFDIAGYALSNTSTDRSSLKTPVTTLDAFGRGGLSGKPLRKKATELTRHLRSWLPDKTIIGIGGIDSAEAASERLQAGADLIQVYTGLIYEGPGLIQNINKALAKTRAIAP